MQLFIVVPSALLSMVTMFLSVKLIGNRQMSELNMFDYINGITIGSIAAEMATSLETDILKPLIAMVVYTVVVLAISVLSARSLKLRRLFYGKSLVLMSRGKLYERNFKKGRVDLSEFLNQCRVQGYYCLDDIEYAYLEQNGKISVLPKAEKRPVNPSDLKLVPQEDLPFYSVIMDGHILEKNIIHLGKNREWLTAELSKQGCTDIKDIFFACADSNGCIYVFRRQADAPENDMFQ